MARKAHTEDTLVVYAACHGVAVGQRFYLIPHGFHVQAAQRREEAVRLRGLPADELGDELSKVSALKRILIFDTCHSGSAAALAGLGRNPFGFRGAIERRKPRPGSIYAGGDGRRCSRSGEQRTGAQPPDVRPLGGGGGRGPGAAGGAADWAGTAGRSGGRLVMVAVRQSQVPGLYQQYVGREQQVELSGLDQPSFPLLTIREK